MIEQLLQNLNPPQRKAVETTDGLLLILAGAGTGKTSVLTRRIAYILLQGKAQGGEILAMTFTNKAAEEMKERLFALIGSQARHVTLTTFHSFCLQVLKREIEHLGYTRNFTLYSEQECKRVIQGIAKDLLQHEGDLPSLQGTMQWIAEQSSKGFSKIEEIEDLPPPPELPPNFPQGIAPDSGPDSGPGSGKTKQNPAWYGTFCKELLSRYELLMRAHNAVNFDLLLQLTHKLFETFPAILQKYQKLYRYILIDEYQDTNPIQSKIASLLSGMHNNLCVVGDDDQSIYSWRGARVQEILEFPAHTQIKLEQNYRSQSNILLAANSVITKNKLRKDKTLWSHRKSDHLIEVFHAPTEKQEAESVAKRIVHCKMKHNIPWNEIAVLYRSNALAIAIEEALLEAVWNEGSSWKRGVPHEVIGGLEYTERAEIKDVLSFLRVICNPLDEQALLRIINVPRRGISDQALDKLTQLSRTEAIPLWHLCTHIDRHSDLLSSKALSGIKSFVSSIEEVRSELKTIPASIATKNFLEKIQYKKAISEEVKSDRMRQFKWENVERLITALGAFEADETIAKEEKNLIDFLRRYQINDVLDSAAAGHDRVQLMTLHSAKGLEFTACFIVGVEDHLLPHEKSTKPEQIEEERRLFYVGLTRAKEFLTLSMSQSRKRMGQQTLSRPSRFLYEIPGELLKASLWNDPCL